MSKRTFSKREATTSTTSQELDDLDFDQIEEHLHLDAGEDDAGSSGENEVDETGLGETDSDDEEYSFEIDSDNEDENQSGNDDLENQSVDEDENHPVDEDDQSVDEDENHPVDEDDQSVEEDENRSVEEDGNQSAEEDENQSVDDENQSVNDYNEGWEDAEYTDTSDEEELRNTVGNIPLDWYNDYPHIGYDLDGKKITKPLKGDQLDEFLRKMDDPDYWRTVTDSTSGKEIVLNDEDLELIERIQTAQYPESSYDPYAPYEDVYSHEKMIHPVSNRPEPKRRFLPSLWERKKIMKMVKAIKSGALKPIKKPEKPKFYNLWNDSAENEKLRPHQYIPAPKVRLPGTAESYNPPPQYLPTEEQKQRDRPGRFRPTSYSALRLVPGYKNFVKERFERCLDLYLCPRQTRMRIRVDPESLIPKLPSPKDLQPFPTTESVEYKGHSSIIRSIDLDGMGVWLSSVSDDCTLKLWEVSTGRCTRTIPLPGRPSSVEFCPNSKLSVIAVAVESSLVIINHGLDDRLVVAATDSAFSSFEKDENSVIEWTECDNSTADYASNGYRRILKHTKSIQQVTWHYKGDYFSTVSNEGGVSIVYIHQLSKQRSQNPFKSLKGLVQKVAFHPSKPFFFVATQTYVRVYNLVKQELSKKLSPGVKWISSIAIHPKGDNLIIGSYDKRICWFDMDLSAKPYKTLRYHGKAVRQVCYHSTYPLFASSSDDDSVIISHGMVYNDLMQNPLIVPVKILKGGHSSVDSLGIMDCQFHPSQPWIFTAGADGVVKLYS